MLCVCVVRGICFQFGVAVGFCASVGYALAGDLDRPDAGDDARGVAAFASVALTGVATTRPISPRRRMPPSRSSSHSKRGGGRTSAQDGSSSTPKRLERAAEMRIASSPYVARSNLAGPPPPAPATPSIEPEAERWIWPEASSSTATKPWREVWAGGDWIENAWTAYAGFGAAPFGTLAENGWRVRSVAGYGRYHYERHRWIGKNLVPIRHDTTKTFADLLVGYQQGFGALTLKGFVGLAGRADLTTPYDAANPSEGMHYGVKIESDAWLEMSPMMWAALSASWTSVNSTFAGRGRIGVRLTPQISVGVEAASVRSDESDTGRLGGFVRYAWDAGEVSLAAGMSGSLDGGLGDRLTRVRSDDSPYVSVNWLTRF
jgi:hypothetical protein